MNFCRRCASPLTSTDNHVYSCANGHIVFANSSPCVGVFLLDQNDNVYLSVRGIEPRKGMLDTLGGFVDSEETLEQAVERELKEEVGLNPGDYTKPAFLTSGIGHYPYKGETITILSSMFWARLKTTQTLQPADDVAEIFISPIDDIDVALLHDDDIRIGLETLRNLLKNPSS